MEKTGQTNQNQQLLSPPEDFEIPKTLHSGNRERLLSRFKSGVQNSGKNALLFFKGAPTIPLYDDDINFEQTQEANFYYLFGVDDLDCYGWISVETGESTLFVPKFPQAYRMWMKFDEPKVLKEKHGVTHVRYNDEIEATLKELAPEVIYILHGISSDSDAPPLRPEFPFLSNFKVDNTHLYNILAECRVRKSEDELKVMRFVNKLSSDAHVRVMRNTKAGLKEFQSEALFKFHCHERAGTRNMAYNLICACDRDASTLHYIINDKVIRDGSMMLNDMGAKFHGYCADITCTFPVNGKFTKHQAEIYNAVLEAALKVKNALKPGVKWDDMHLLAERSMVSRLIEYGLIVQTPLEELEAKRIGAIFFPHGLGHLIGLCTHDVGGYIPGTPERLKEAGLKSLRTRRVMEENITITIEPGCYFIDFAIEAALSDPERGKYLNAEKIKEYSHIGGVRIEEVVVVTKDGCELLSDCPRTVEEIEKCMAGLNWKN